MSVHVPFLVVVLHEIGFSPLVMPLLQANVSAVSWVADSGVKIGGNGPSKGNEDCSRAPSECTGDNSGKVTGEKPNNRQGLQRIQCKACGQYGYIACNCSQKWRQGPEFPGRQQSSTADKPKDSLKVHGFADYNDKEVEQGLPGEDLTRSRSYWRDQPRV